MVTTRKAESRYPRKIVVKASDNTASRLKFDGFSEQLEISLVNVYCRSKTKGFNRISAINAWLFKAVLSGVQT